jgi:radical SAM superfamily enzyme YgiQ (UPF0313 family)
MRVSLVTSPHLDHSVFHRRESGVRPNGRTRFAQCFAPMGLLSLAGQIEPVAPSVIADVNKAINSQRLPMSPSFYDATAEWLLEADPDLVGIMTEADSYHHVVRIAQALKARRRSVLTVLGGPHASAVHRETLELFAGVDYIVRGEGEIAFEQLVRALGGGGDVSGVGNLTYRSGGRDIATNAELPLIADLDTLPWPDVARIDLAPEDIVYLEVGRGCPFRCNFCFTAPYWKRKHRIKSAERVIAELVYFRDRYGRTDFNFTHDLLTTDRRWVLDFCRKAVARRLGVTWTCSSRTDTIDQEQIEWMRKAGCRDIYFGVEAGTAEMQAKIDKHLDLVQSRAIVRAAVDEGIGATVGFIAGLPGESAVTLRGTLGEAFHYLSLNGTTVHLFGFSPYKGSSQFPQIDSELVLDDRFIDFPLSDAVHTENAVLMREHMDVFARYGRLRTFDGLPEEIVRTAEEFFPIVNALRPLMLHLVERGLDPFETLLAWSRWIGDANARAGHAASGMYAGTIDQFIAFLTSYLPATPHWDGVVVEMLRWEKTKNVLRTHTLAARLPQALAVADSIALTRNPTLLMERFRYARSFVPDAGADVADSFGFYLHADGSSAIVALGELAALILEVAREPIAEDDIAFALEAFAGPGQRRVSEDVRAVVRRLYESELLVGHASQNSRIATGPACS